MEQHEHGEYRPDGIPVDCVDFISGAGGSGFEYFHDDDTPLAGRKLPIETEPPENGIIPTMESLSGRNRIHLKKSRKYIRLSKPTLAI